MLDVAEMRHWRVTLSVSTSSIPRRFQVLERCSPVKYLAFYVLSFFSGGFILADGLLFVDYIFFSRSFVGYDIGSYHCFRQ